MRDVNQAVLAAYTEAARSAAESDTPADRAARRELWRLEAMRETRANVRRLARLV